MKKAEIVEQQLNSIFSRLASEGIYYDTVRDHCELFNELIITAYTFFSEVALRTRRNFSQINSTGIEFDEFIDDAIMKLIDKNYFNVIIRCDEDIRIPYIMRTVNNLVTDKDRAWFRIYPQIKKRYANSAHINYSGD